MLTTGSLVSSATAIRMVAGHLELLMERTPQLAQLALSAAVSGNARAQSAFRDDLLALARESTDLSSREMRRGLDDLDQATRPGPKPGARPHRPYRVKP
jgi:hypothetical protein